MRVTIFRDLKEEGWPSMELYPDELVATFERGGFEGLSLRQFRMRGVGLPGLPADRPPGLYLNRGFFYPLRARGHQGEINHIIDHSYGHLLHLLDPRRSVVTCHDLVPLVLRGSFPKRSVGLRLWDWAFRGMTKAARIIADSENTRQDILRFSDYDPSKVRVIWEGVSGGFKRICDEAALAEVRQRFALPDGFVILHVGHCAARKNLEGLLHALSQLEKRRVGFHFLQMGGSFGESQQGLVHRLDLEGKVTQLSRVSQEDLVLLYNLADVLVLPSFYEGFGLPLLEAMACGLPAIAANRASLPEVAGDAALLVEPEDVEGLAGAIESVLGDGELRKELARRGLERARLFTWERCAQQTYQVYRELYEELCG